MRGITTVVKTDLYWETLGELRNTPYYGQLVESIGTCIRNKMNDRQHKGGNDTPFSAEKALKGLWHCRLAQSPLKILFYSVEGDTLNLCKVGDHDDYGWKGKNSKASDRLAERIGNALRRGNVPYADWQTFRWSHPDRIAGHPDLPMMSGNALRRLDKTLFDELEGLDILARKYGGDVNAVPVDVAVEWLGAIESCRDRLADTIDARVFLERKFKDGSDAAFSMTEPPRERLEAYGMRFGRG